MAGIWTTDRPLSPGFLRAAFSFLGAFLAALAAVNVLIGMGALLGGRFGAALVEFTAGTAIPFAVWLALRLWADSVTLQREILARLDATSLNPPAASAARRSAPPGGRASGPNEVRAEDDGPAYPDADEAEAKSAP